MAFGERYSLKFDYIHDVRPPPSTTCSMADDHLVFIAMAKHVVAPSLLTRVFGSYVYVLDVLCSLHAICHVSDLVIMSTILP